MNIEQTIIVLIAVAIGILAGIAHGQSNQIEELEKRVKCIINSDYIEMSMERCLEEVES